jgi:hypothetical protein
MTDLRSITWASPVVLVCEEDTNMTLLDQDTDLLDYAIREEFRRIMNDVGPSGLPEFLHVGNDVYVARGLCTKAQYDKAIRLLLEDADRKTRVAHDLANEAVGKFYKTNS